MYTTRKTLLKRLQNNDDISWEEFYRIYWPLVQSIGGRIGLPEDACQDLMQRVMLDLFHDGELLHYDASRGKFRTFFGMLVRHEAWEMLRDTAKHAEASCAAGIFPGDGPSSSPLLAEQRGEAADDPFGRMFDEEYRKCLLAVAMDELRNCVSPKTYAIFEMVVLQERPPREVARHLGLGRAVIDVYCSRCRKALRRIISEIRTDNPDFTIDMPL